MAEREDDEQPQLRAALGGAVRMLREGKRLSQRSLAARIPCNQAYLARIETGAQLPSDSIVETLDEFFDTGGLLMNLLEAARVGTIQSYSRAGAEKEARAERIQLFTTNTIPGLLQTPDYAREIFRSFRPESSDDALDERVQARVRRQKVFKRKESPLFWGIIDEAAIRRPVGSKDCMRAQLTHLLTIAEHPRVTIQIHPFARGEHAFVGGGSLTLLTGPDAETVAYLESYGSGELVSSPRQVIQWTQLFDTERSRALDMDASLELIDRYRKEEYS